MQYIKIAYADQNEQLIIDYGFDRPTTIEQAIKESGILERIALPDPNASLSVGIFGKSKLLTDTVKSGDRVEIYRPLKIDPKDIRRQRAEQQRLASKKA